jgi:sulfoquinovosyltransferase
MVYAVIAYAKLLAIPLVVSYHTHVPDYIPKYTWPGEKRKRGGESFLFFFPGQFFSVSSFSRHLAPLAQTPLPPLSTPPGFVRPMWSLIRFFTRAADLTLVPSPTMKRVLAANGTDEAGIDVWRQAVDTEFFHPRFRSEEVRARISEGLTASDPGAVVLTYVGRLGAEKNLHVLKDLLAALPPSVCLSLVGDGPAREELEAHFAGTRTHFTGMIKGDDLAAAYASADIFVMPSETETLGFVALEAMASGLPVVAVAAGGLVDIVTRPGDIGFLYPAGDYKALEDSTRALVKAPAERARVAGLARAHVETLGWLPAVRSVRDGQYSRAIRVFGLKRAAKLVRWKAALKGAAGAALVALLAVAAWALMGARRLPTGLVA